MDTLICNISLGIRSKNHGRMRQVTGIESYFEKLRSNSQNFLRNAEQTHVCKIPFLSLVEFSFSKLSMDLNSSCGFFFSFFENCFFTTCGKKSDFKLSKQLKGEEWKEENSTLIKHTLVNLTGSSVEKTVTLGKHTRMKELIKSHIIFPSKI